MNNYFDELLSTLDSSLKTVDNNMFTKLIDNCISTLKSGHKIILSGLGKNVPVCDKFVGTMNSLGLDAVFMNTNSAVHGDIGVVKDGDLVILLTKSGETVESVYLSSLLDKRDCEQWLLSFEKDSTLSRKITNNIILDLSHEGDEWNIVPNNSTTLNLIVLQMLAMQVSKKMGVTLEQFKINHPGGHIGEILNEK